jgi:ABC-type polysaccharide/polyol phosphate transport system ATPase subunit
VFINGMMLGLSKAEIARRFDDIVSFAELGEFIDEPVKTYSSGMYMRLGFAVAINVDPDVLLVDEVLAVGDEAFTHKCLEKFAEFKRRRKTIVLVTHTLDLVTRLCDEAVWLDGGQRACRGRPQARGGRLSARGGEH